MTEIQSFTLLQTSKAPKRTADAHRTIFRDNTLAAEAPFTGPGLYATDDSDQITPMIHLGLAALLLPTLAYAASVLVSLMSSGSLEKAVRAMMP